MTARTPNPNALAGEEAAHRAVGILSYVQQVPMTAGWVAVQVIAQ
jgi:hypothetical protein